MMTRCPLTLNQNRWKLRGPNRIPSTLWMLAMLMAVVATAADFDFDAFWREPSVDAVPFDEVVLEQGETDGVRWRQFVYTSMRYQGQPVRVVAVYGTPADMPSDTKRPALVMTHGLFGRAALDPIVPFVQAGYPTLMWEWEIRYRPDRIEIPDDGLVSQPHTFYPLALYPERRYPRADPDDWQRTIWYPAIIAGRRAITWLQAQPEVDPDRIGATGGSYGGQASSLLATVDARIRAAVPYSFSPLTLESVSGLLSLNDLSPDQKRDYARRFDAAENLHRTQAAFYWQVGTHDRPFFPPTIHATLARSPAPRALWVLPNIDHIHPSPMAALAWFETILGAGAPFPDPGPITAAVTDDGIQVRLTPKAGDIPLTHVTVYWSDLVPAPEYTAVLWRAQPAEKDPAGVWQATLNPRLGGVETTIQLIANIRDARGAIVSSSPPVTVNLKGYTPSDIRTDDAVAVNGTIRIPRFETEPPLDGDLTQWPKTAWTPPFPLQFVSGSSAVKPPPKSHTVGEMDARFAAGWTPRHLVMVFRVHSPFPLVNAAPAKPFWFGDSFQVRIFGGPGADTAPRPGDDDVVLHLNGWRDSAGQPILDGQIQHGQQPAKAIEDWADSELKFFEVQGGGEWIAETRIPWSLLHLQPGPDLHLRMGLQVNIGNETGDMSLGYCEYNNGQNFGQPHAWGVAVLEGK